MAVSQSAEPLRGYRQYYYKKIIGVFALVLLNTLLALGIILAATGAAPIDKPNFWLIILIIFIIEAASFAAAMKVIAEPLCQILAALSHKAGVSSSETPPDINDKRYEKSGFKAVLQIIYDKPTTVPANHHVGSENSFLIQSLNRTSCGIAIFNSKKQIIFANSAAPIARGIDGKDYLALEFLNEPSISEWLDEISNKETKAEQRWYRIATSPEVVKTTKIYDIVASFEKGAEGETVIFLIDKSSRYVPEEEDLNFISFAAHELRGPITVIRGYLDIIADEFADRLHGDEAQLMDRLIVSANRLSSYIDNILNVSRFDRHHLKVHLLEDTIHGIYDSIADDMQLRAATQHRLLNVNIPNDLPTVAADRGSISEVISNLIDNAIKYSFEGGVISVTAERRGDFIEVSVADNGIGMPANVVNNLFHKFYRSHRSREAVAGTGIGLYICKAFVESHGGSITARSRENEGSVFSFTLPIYATVKDKLLEDGQLNNQLIRKGGGWIKNHAMYRD